MVTSETRSRFCGRQKLIKFDGHTFTGTGCAEACMEATRLGTDKIPQSHIRHLQFTVWELRMRAAGLAFCVPKVHPDRVFLAHPARLAIIPEAICGGNVGYADLRATMDSNASVITADKPDTIHASPHGVLQTDNFFRRRDIFAMQVRWVRAGQAAQNAPKSYCN